MILTKVDTSSVLSVLPSFRQGIACDPVAVAVFDRITAVIPPGDLMRLSMDAQHHTQGVELCRRFGFGIKDCDPQEWFTWDGFNVATRMEPSVLIHEVAHFQCASPYRRNLPDFGLGAGPETGKGRAAANAVQTVYGALADMEEGMTSLLGILWEAELGQPAILGFLEQNWLEGGADARNVAHFLRMVHMLKLHHMVDAQGHPTEALRRMEDPPFFDQWYNTFAE